MSDPVGTWTFKAHPDCAILFQVGEDGDYHEVGRVRTAASASFICEMCNGVELNELRKQVFNHPQD